MADLKNLLNKINVCATQDEDEPEIYTDPSPSTRPSIPSALAAAADRRESVTQYEEEVEGETSHLPNPEYEQLKSLWTQELICPELLPADAETTSLHVDFLEGQEEIIEDLLQRWKESQQGSNVASGELASLMAQITKMDLDWTRFMLVDLARVRMAKIENYEDFGG